MLFPLFGSLWITSPWAVMHKFVENADCHWLVGIYLEVKLLDHTVTLILTFELLPNCFPKWQQLLVILTAMCKGSNLHILTNTYYYLNFDYSHPSGYKVIFYCGCNLYFPNDWLCWAFFHVIIGHLYIFFEKCLFKLFAHYLLGLSFYCWIVKVLYVFWIQVP